MAKEQLAGEYTSLPTLTDSVGNKHRDFKLENINTYGIDCSIFDCSGTLNLYKFSGWGNVSAENLNLDLSQTEYKTSDNKYKFNITE
ncbi:hypothetical protein [Campylobacter mucosalis]|uniref:hypothetical protein n=1 Tax=Campylobacter mucosalis TaxID=202 RepID=UPI001C131B40|nr:hypothetical protein [Campylobacter mucosalis]